MFLKDTRLRTKCKGKKFIRRQDLTADVRPTIAYMAMHGTWGMISQLAEAFMISRTFVYMLMKDLKEITEVVFGNGKTYVRESVKEKAIPYILSLRLVGRCSIISISLILKRMGISKCTFVGSVSKILQFAGDSLPHTLEREDGAVKLVILASDEIFSHLKPILMSVDPVSSTILRMYLNTTKNHVNQGMLNLFMFYHNHRRYVAGKRKGKTPMEIFTGRKQEQNRLELLIERVPGDQVDFLKST